MRIAIPIANEVLCMHFGHCEQFVLLDVDLEQKAITAEQTLTPPPHEPGLLPRWLAEKGVNMVIAGGMGSRAQALFAEQHIQTIAGAPSAPARALAQAYLDGALETGNNSCSH